MNVPLAFIVLMGFSLFQGIPTKEARLGNLAPGEAAVKSGPQKGDRIVSVNGDKVSNWEELVSFIQQNPGEKLVFEVDRNGKILKKEVTPGEREINKGTKEGFIGAYPSTEFSLPGSVSYGAKQTWFMTKMIFVGLGELITGKHGFDQLSGPVGIYEYTNKATEGGIPMLMQWAAVLSINLAIFNFFAATGTGWRAAVVFTD